ncbi:MAG: acetamidase/formamidase family protein, partial [Chlamydiia bacterium]|nr:acetamidase/formamidase family protein [Chlamydiia bacterium]
MQSLAEPVHRIKPCHETRLKVHPGQAFSLPLLNAFGKRFETLTEFEAFLSPDNEEEKSRLNHPCTGPIEIVTDRKNISLAITIVDMHVDRGYQCISKSTGLLKGEFTERECAIYDVAKDGGLYFNGDDIIMRGSPKLGFITTMDDQERSAGRACQNGGNLDMNLLDRGATIYLPVNAEVPRILVGDLHVCQGNGEACGIAVEADGEVTLRVEIVDKIDFPVIQHKDYLVLMGWGDTMEQSLACSVRNTIS